MKNLPSRVPNLSCRTLFAPVLLFFMMIIVYTKYDTLNVVLLQQITYIKECQEDMGDAVMDRLDQYLKCRRATILRSCGEVCSTEAETDESKNCVAKSIFPIV